MFFRAWLVDSPPQSLNRKGLGLPEICPERKLNVKILSPSKSTSPVISLKEEPGLEWLQAFTTFTRNSPCCRQAINFSNVFCFFALNPFWIVSSLQNLPTFCSQRLGFEKRKSSTPFDFAKSPAVSDILRWRNSFWLRCRIVVPVASPGGQVYLGPRQDGKKKPQKFYSPNIHLKKNSSRILE